MLRLLSAFLVLSGLWGAAKDIVWFDTDSGLFGDDGAALVMLLRSPSQVTVQGITIVPGNVWAPQGAEYMFHILDLMKRSPAGRRHRRRRSADPHHRDGEGIGTPLGHAQLYRRLRAGCRRR